MMLFRLMSNVKGWHNISSVHLMHKKQPPPIVHTFTPRGLIINPSGTPPQAAPAFAPIFAQPSSELVVPPAPSTFLPLSEPPAEELPTVRSTRKYMSTSVRKVVPLLLAIRKLHVLDAIAAMERSAKKPAYWIKNIIKNAVRSGVQTKDMYDERLYIKEAFVGKNTPMRGIRRHAKGKGNRSVKPRSQITVVLEEKTPENMFAIIMQGKHSPSLAQFLRASLLDKDAKYDEVRKYQNLLTAKGRQQQRLMLHRKVCKEHRALLEQGLVIPKERLEKQILAAECKGFVEAYWAAKRVDSDRKLAERMELYKKNEGIK